MKKILLFTLLIFSFFVFGQKIKIKKNVVLVDDKEWLLSEDNRFDYSLFDKNKKEVIFLKFFQQNLDDAMVFNDIGKPNYYSVKFIDTGKTFEIRDLPNNIIKIIYKADIFNTDFSFNMEKLNLLIEKYGNEFSKNKDTTTNTIIIQQDSTPKSGINVRIGL